MYLTSTADVEKIVPEIAAMPIIGVDTETTGLDPFESELLLVQLGNLDKQYVIDARQCSLEPLREILESRKVKVLHNAKFDYKMLKACAGIRMENVVDTMLIEQVLRNGRRAEGGNGLAAVVERYTRKKVSKEEQQSFINHTGDFTKAQLEYARRDVIYPLEVLHKQMPLVRKAGLEHTVKLECLAVTAIADIELNGVAIDQERWMGIAQQAQEKATEFHGKLDEQFESYIEQTGEQVLFTAGRIINYDSDRQLRDALLHLGIEVESTSKAVLASLEHPVGQVILEYRQHQKIVSTYGATFLEHVHRKTGRIHCDFRQLGAESGRLSSTKPNLQNIPSDSEFRSCFIAGEGRKAITADYSGCELRILADMSQDDEFLRAFRNNEDLHSLVATMMFKVPVSKDENKELRQAAKAINFGLAYGMSSKGLAAQIGCPDEEAEDLLEKYFEGFPKIASFLEQSGRLAVSRGYSTTIGGRRRWFDISDVDQDRRARGSIERKGKNSPIQGTNADMIKLALFRLREELHARDVDAALVNTVHDEIVVECEESIALEVQELVEKVMRAAGEYYVKSVPVDVESAIADCWSK
ncbi:hypothetical protein HN371_24030 [Candidatus Poribacteria bacterium]|jgi:DNA polymerase I|nr:hypothetical protein [Candidatus Poribacteria bacterium]MBT5534376.1 hypothetical protein [Candidatus Poribacteria bacterium]MBT5714340.1 hypothetical protein [Candidatus Poribacteria bacterium]MBT7807132.1 hypothetical protein [Candidatus Poribacteria bacterium]